MGSKRATELTATTVMSTASHSLSCSLSAFKLCPVSLSEEFCLREPLEGGNTGLNCKPPSFIRATSVNVHRQRRGVQNSLPEASAGNSHLVKGST